MIKYSLICENDHEFEGWFASSGEFTNLQAAGYLDCPNCGSSKVNKMLMAPSVRSTKGKSANALTDQQGGIISNMPVAAAPVPAMRDIPVEVREQVINQLSEMKKHVLANAENVGKKFSDEARKIHYGESEQRGIYGETTAEQAAELLEEGIDIMPLPVLPEERD